MTAAQNCRFLSLVVAERVLSLCAFLSPRKSQRAKKGKEKGPQERVGSFVVGFRVFWGAPIFGPEVPKTL